MSEIRNLTTPLGDGHEGRLHWWRFGASDDTAAAPLVCLHPLPFGGDFFRTTAAHLAPTRRVWSPDYPGFGQSDPLPDPWSVEAWADAVALGLATLDVDQPADLLGFHTGCLVAAELALEHPDRVRRLVLVDAPYFDQEQRKVLGEHTATAPRHHGNAAAIEGFRAAFAYDPIANFRHIGNPALVIGTESSLHGPSEAAARAMPGGRFLGRPDLEAPVFEQGARDIAACVAAFLDDL